MENLINLRKEKGLKQSDLAQFLNISKQTYCHYEKNRYEPDIKTLKKLADFFDCSIDYLLEHETKEKDKKLVFNLKKLQSLRKSVHLTQKELSQKLGIPKSTYAHYESGRCEPDLSRLIKLADFFGCTVDYLLGHEIKEILHMHNFTRTQQIVIDDLKKLDDDLCEKVESYVKGILEVQMERKEKK